MRNSIKRKCACGDVAPFGGSAHHVHMAKKPTSRHFIREWRKARGYTLEQLAERIGMTHQNLGKIERGQVPFNQLLLEALADQLRCTPADLQIRDPSDPDGIWSVWDTLNPTERVQAVQVIKAIKGTGTNG